MLGGGFTTFDCTRTSLRLGAKVHTVYRRGRKEMGATFEEVEDGESEGTDLQLFGAAIAHRFDEGWQASRASSSSACSSASRMPPAAAARCLLRAASTSSPATRSSRPIGQKPDRSGAAAGIGREVDEAHDHRDRPYNFMTARKGVFAGGDCRDRRRDDHRVRGAGQARRARD